MPRRIKVFYYCDEYAGYQNLENEKLSADGYSEIERDIN